MEKVTFPWGKRAGISEKVTFELRPDCSEQTTMTKDLRDINAAQMEHDVQRT